MVGMGPRVALGLSLAGVCACGPGQASDGESGSEAESASSSEVESGSASGEGESGDTGETSDTGELPPCPLAELETFDIEGLVGEETVVQEVEVLASGELLVAGYFGLMRREPAVDEFVFLDAPELLSSSFLQLRRGHGEREVWAAAFDELGRSFDAGETWEVWQLEHDAVVHRLDPDSADILLGADDLIGTFDDGIQDWFGVPELSDLNQNNTIMALIEREGRLIAGERFGRLATAEQLGGPWTSIEVPPASDPEFLDLGSLGVLFLTGDGLVLHSADGLDWSMRGQAEGWPNNAAVSTQLGFRPQDQVVFAAGSDGLQVSCDLGESWTTLALGTESTVIYDVSIADDGTVWAAGFNHVHRIGPS